MLLSHSVRRFPSLVLAGCALALVLCTLAYAQSAVAGKWEGTTRNGFLVVLDFKVTNTLLSGTVTRDGESSTLSEGKVSGTTITFKVVLGEQTESLTGQLDGEQLKVWLDRQGPEGTVVFKRVKQ